MPQFILTLVVGIVVGVLGNFSFEWVQEIIARFFGRIEIKGIWGERILNGSERVNSIGQIRYDIRKRMWVFDGTNYHNDGSAFCHWRTITSYVDRQEKRYYYIFLNTQVGHTQAGYTGFGFVDLELKNGVWVPRNGAFADGDPGGTFRSHSMIRLDQMPSGKTEVLATFARLALEDSIES